jgi:glycosyltransferase involved in cell wall biosynthesis
MIKAVYFGKSFSRVSAGNRLHKALEDENIIIKLVAHESSLRHVDIYKKSLFQRKILSRLRSYYLNLKYKDHWKDIVWTNNIFSPKVIDNKFYKEFNLIHLDWIANGTINLTQLKNNKRPIIMTLHDVWALTGGCHYNFDCQKWESGCGACPQLESKKKKDLSSTLWNKKLKSFQNIPNLTIITPSKWLAEMAQKSPLLKNRKIIAIPNCLDTEIFKPFDKKLSREVLNIPQDVKIILTGAANVIHSRYKGFSLLVESLRYLKSNCETKFVLVIFGATESDINHLSMPFQKICLGNIYDEHTLALAYNCADVFVGPSQQDNLPGTFLEASACGTPSVGFDIGGIPEIVEHRKNGYIAKPFDTNDLAYGIEWVLEDKERHQLLSNYARQKALDCYSYKVIAQKHIELYKKILLNT